MNFASLMKMQENILHWVVIHPMVAGSDGTYRALPALHGMLAMRRRLRNQRLRCSGIFRQHYRANGDQPTVFEDGKRFSLLLSIWNELQRRRLRHCQLLLGNIGDLYAECRQADREW